MSWQIQEAKQRFSELVRKAQDEGPQVVTRHGEDVAVLVSAKAYRELTGNDDFKAFLMTAPLLHDLDLERPAESVRELDLG